MIWGRRRVRTEALACRELVELVTDYLEGVLSPDLLQAFNHHIAGCGSCTEYLRQMKRTIELEHQVGTATADEPAASNEVPARMLDALLAEFRTHRGG